jgi:hypothetical protein
MNKLPPLLPLSMGTSDISRKGHTMTITGQLEMFLRRVALSFDVNLKSSSFQSVTAERFIRKAGRPHHISAPPGRRWSDQKQNFDSAPAPKLQKHQHRNEQSL